MTRRPGFLLPAWRALGVAAALVLAVPALAAQRATGDSLWALGEHDAAVRAYEEELATNPGEPRSLYRMGVLLSWAGKFDSALALLRTARLRDPDDGEIRLHQARVESWAGQYGLSVLHYDSLLQKDAHNLGAAIGRAQVLSWAGRLVEADQAYAEVLQEDPGNLDALAGRGYVASWSGNLGGASGWFEQALARDSANVNALNGLAMVRVWQADAGAATRLSRRAVALAPDDPTTKDVAARVHAARQPTVGLTLGWSRDSDENEMWTQAVNTAVLLGPGLRGFARAGVAEASDPFQEGTRYGAEAGLTLIRGSTSFTGAVGARKLAPGSLGSRSLATARAAVSAAILPRTTAWLGWAHYSFDETALLLTKDLDVDEVNTEVSTQAGRLTVTGGAGLAWFSDDNVRRNAHLLLSQPLRGRLTGGLFGRIMAYENRGSGYFTPDQFLLGEARLSWGWARRSWDTYLAGGLGVQKVGSAGDPQSQWHLEGRVARQLGLNDEVALSGGVSNSAVSSTVGAFRYYSAQLSVRLGL